MHGYSDSMFKSKWRVFLGVFIAAVAAYLITSFIPIPSLYTLPYGLEKAIISGIIVLILYIILDKVGL